MAKYGSSSVVIEFDGADGGALTDMSQHVQSINGTKISKLTEESHTFGDAWFEALQTGIKRMENIVLEGLYDDTATTGPDAVWNIAAITHAVTRTFKITYGGTKTTSVETWILSYERMPVRGALTRFRVELQPTGAVSEA